VGVRVDAFEVRPEGQLEDLELGQLGQDPVPPDAFARTGADEDAVHGRSVSYERVFV
jgi:hypothetical protein